MKIVSVTLNDGTFYMVGKLDVEKIIFHHFYLADYVFEVIFTDDRVSVKIPYHSVQCWR